MRSETIREFLNTVFERHVPRECEIRIIDMHETVSQVTGLPCRYQLLDMEYAPNLKIRAVQVEDHTTHKTVFLKVPISEETSTCLGAIAWTFGLDEETYKPSIET